MECSKRRQRFLEHSFLYAQTNYKQTEKATKDDKYHIFMTHYSVH